MKRSLLLFLAFFVLNIRVDAQTISSFEKPSKKEFRKAVATVLYRTDCLSADQEKRLDALSVIQREINNFSPEDWKDYNTSDSVNEKEGVPYSY